VNTILLFVTNGQFTGGGMIINPHSLINDGLLDISWIEPEMGLCGVAKNMDKAKKGGLHAYDDGVFRFRRGK
jgi:diacylglycerol kinase family enzyme